MGHRGGPGEEDAEEYMHPYVQGAFGVLYVVSKEKGAESWSFAFFRLGMDFLQLFLLVVNPVYGWAIADTGGWKAASAIGLNWVVTELGWSLYLALFYVMVFMLIMVIALCIWVAYSFSNNNFSHVWPITFLRWYSNIFFKVLEVASMSLLLIVLDCQYFPPENDPSQQYHNQEFPHVVCFAGMHMVHAAVAIISLIVFVVVDAFMQMAEMELNPLARNLMATAHTKVEVQGFLLKVLMTCACAFLNKPKYLAIVYLGCTTAMLWLQISCLPNIYAGANHLRAATMAVVWYCSVLFMAIAYYPNSDGALNESVRETITLALWVGMVPAGCLGAAASWAQTYYFHGIVLPRFRESQSGTKSNRVIFRVTDAREIEILSRCCRVWVDDDMVDQDAVALAETVLKYGLATLGPKSAYMIILSSSFLIDVQSSYQSGYSQLQAAKKADPSLLERFAIFAREQQHAQQASGAGGPLGHKGPDVNLVSFVEYKKNYRLATIAHREALQALRQFWTHLMQPDACLNKLTKAVQRIKKAVTAAEKVYRKVLVRHSTNVRMLRLYARFLEDVKHDPWSAAKWYTEAERHELAEEDAKNTNIFSELGIDPGTAEAEGLGDLFGLLEMDGGLGAHANRAVFVINAQCIVQLANPAVCKMFGYSSNNEIKGRNINMIIPAPMAEQHNQAVRNYVLTGKETMVGHTTEIVALSKHKAVFPITLQVSKISGIGEDMLFMGIIQAAPVEPNTATCWVMMGSECVMSVDSGFTDYFGFRPEELAGATLDKWLVDPRDVLSVFNRLRHEVIQNEASLHGHISKVASGKPPVLNLAGDIKDDLPDKVEAQVRHRYLDAVSAQLTITPSGTGTYRFFAIRMEVPTGTGHIMVTDSSGRLLHASHCFASSLGVSTQALMSDNAAGAFQALLPQPFAALHTEYLGDKALSRPSAPPYSCRSGLSVMITAASTSGPPKQKPFRMALTERVNDKGDMLHIASLIETSMDQALGERRVRLVLDHDGKVLDVLSGDARVFGFPCEMLQGLVLGDFLDAFQGHYSEAVAGHPNGKGWDAQAPWRPPRRPSRAEETAQRFADVVCLEQEDPRSKLPSAEMHKALLIMAARAKEAPLTSWRVGVLPTCIASSMPLASQLQSTGLRSAAPPVPAIMAMRVVEAAHPGTAIANRNSILAPRSRHASETGGLDDHEREAQRIDAALGLSPVGLVYVIDLWKATTFSGVMELDSSGVVSHSTSFALHPPGILLGVSAGELVGQHMGRFLNLPAGLQASAFLSGELGATAVVQGQDTSTFSPSVHKMRSNLKGGVARRANDKLTGPTSLITVKHRTDESVLELSVQAVRKVMGPPAQGGGGKGSSTGVYLILRAVHPTCARPDLVDFLIQQHEEELRSAEEAAQMEAERRARLLETCQQGGQQNFRRGLSVRKVSQTGAGGAYGNPIKPRAVMISRMSCDVGNSPNPSAFLRAASRASLPPPQPAPIYNPRSSLQLAHSSPLLEVATPSPPPRPPIVKGGRSSACMDVSNLKDRVQQWVLSGDLTDDEEPPPDLKKDDSPRIATGQLGPLALSPAEALMELQDLPLSQLKPAPGVMITQLHSSTFTSNSMAGRQLQHSTTGASSAALRHAVSDIESDLNDVEEELPHRRVSDGIQLFRAGAPADDDMDAGEPAGGKAAMSGAMSDAGSERDGSLGEEGGDSGAPGRSEATGEQADYRRGHRFKKLLRLLGNAKVQGRMARFRWHSYGIVAGIVMIHLGLFVLQHELLTDQQEGIKNMYSVGAACRVVGETTHYMQAMEVLHTNRGLASLPGLTNMTDMEQVLNDLDAHIALMRSLHAGVYMGFNKQRQLPSEFGLASIWNDKVLPMTIYSDEYGNLTSRTVNTSLWEAGNRFLALADNVRQNHAAYVAQHNYFWNWSAVQNVVTTGMDVVIPAYYSTMEGFLQLVVQQAKDINRAQLVILVLEGAVMPLASFIYMWILAMQVTALRFNMYVVFILVPMGLIRQLASRAIVLGDEDDENQDDVADNLAKANQPGGDMEGNQSRDPMIKINTAGIKWAGRPQTSDRWYSRWIGHIRALCSAPVAQVNSRRRLSSSFSFALWMAWPACFWAVINLCLNIVAYQALAGVDARVAQLTIVNFVKARFQRAFFYGMETCMTEDPWQKGQVRATLAQRTATFQMEYEAMMHGGHTVNSTAVRFSFTHEGVAADDAKGADLLFRTQRCLRRDQSTCLSADDPYYVWASNGLDRLLTEFLLSLHGMAALPSQSPQPTLNGTQMEFLWKLKPDLAGGLIELSDTFRDSVLSVYHVASTLHIINLVITVVFGFLLYWLMLRPVVIEAQSEARRVAELLSQLPPEVAVEQLVRKALQLEKGPGGGGEGEDDDRSAHGNASGGYSLQGSSVHSSSNGADQSR